MNASTFATLICLSDLSTGKCGSQKTISCCQEKKRNLSEESLGTIYLADKDKLFSSVSTFTFTTSWDTHSLNTRMVLANV